MASYRINWKKGDYISLGKAVSNFNKKIKELETEENKLYLPEPISYNDLKQNITTRKELNRMINSLRRFQRPDATLIYETEAGEKLIKWEKQEIDISRRVATRRLNQEYQALSEPSFGGFSRLQMGSVRAREIEASLKSFRKLEQKVGAEFSRIKKSILSQGRSDYSMKRSITYRENYIEEMKKYKDFENYDKLMKKLESIKNPESFYKFVSKNELTKDLTYNSDMFYSQSEFNRFVSDVLGEEVEDGEDIVKDFMDFKYEAYSQKKERK